MLKYVLKAIIICIKKGSDIVRQWLIEIREKQKMTQDIVAKQVGITRQMIGMIENEKANPHPSTAKAIAEALEFDKYGLSWTAFFDDKQNDKSA